MPHNELPNWYGIPGIGFEWRGSQSDPILHYKGRKFNGKFRVREDFETMAADAVDDLHKPITVLGRTVKASDIAREMLSDDWKAYVNSCISHLIAMEEIKEVR